MIDSNTLFKISNAETYNEKIFKNFIEKTYDLNLPSISGKLYHTLRVTKNCKELCKRLNLDENLGTNIGLLHDFARFEQWIKYQCFVDYKTEDHGDMAVNMLFNQNYIDMFNIEDSHKPIIYFAVKYHNKAKIDYDYICECIDNNSIFKTTKTQPFNLDKRLIYTYCNIARDGDKIDLINRIIAGEFKINYSNDGYTPNCLNQILNNQYVIIQDISTKLDRIFCFIGFLFDLNFSESFSLFSLNDFFNSLLIHYKNILTENDFNFLKSILPNIKNQVINKFSLQTISLKI